ncbi:MAG: biotin carboxylase N-terminal domain-containing protein [Polaromonas sp.]|nr:biotin carboxylase N-terminal domain-containing protein [Polaromonas sp.]
MSFKKILVANRGEIACRVMRTARALGYRTVAVYSDADQHAPHVALADEAVCIGEAPAASSYLSIEALLNAARQTGSDAVHPGYGFLSERADFAEACADAGLVFIGPPASAISAMADKAGAKRRMLAAGVPCVPGYLGEDQSTEGLTEQAHRLGAPLLVKAINGGGGRGMRLVRDLAELPQAIAGARREALHAFGDGSLLLERLIENGRHIEVQVFADAHGNAVHLGERDCTAQRRHQKMIEEAPAPGMTPALRQQMGQAAVAAARAVNYVGAGTVEFIVEQHLREGASSKETSERRAGPPQASVGAFYFLEMNTRLQVEHPVTECVTGLDLVEWQLRIAAGEPLPLKQDAIEFHGHAIEVRLYAEDPYDGFTPQTGAVRYWRPQQALAGRGRGQCAYGEVRIDSGIQEGGQISPYYDPLVAKLIAHGRDRNDAIRRLTALLDDAPLLGVRNNAAFLRDLLDHPAFRETVMHTTLIDQWLLESAPQLQRPEPDALVWALAAAALTAQNTGVCRPASVAAWGLTLTQPLSAECRALRVRPQGAQVSVTLNAGQTFEFESVQLQEHKLSYLLGGVQRHCTCLVRDGSVTLALGATVYEFNEVSAYPHTNQALDPRQLRSPVAGTVSAIAVAVGDTVSAGQPLLCVEAMKMEMWLSARADGTVRAVHAQLQGSVAAGSLLAEIDIDQEEIEP